MNKARPRYAAQITGAQAATLIMMSACATHENVKPMEADLSMVTIVEIYGFESCPNTPEMVSRVEHAGAALPALHIEYVDLEAIPPGDPRRGWPAPSVVIRGVDLFGMPRPQSSGLRCRHYADGLPSVPEIRTRLEQVKGH